MNCPKCKSENPYQDRDLWICPECFHEWIPGNQVEPEEDKIVEDGLIKDCNGIQLKDGDDIVVMKDLKVKGSSSTVKSGTKVKKIRIFDAGDGHNISCKIDGIGSVNLKSEFVRKSN